MLWKEGLFIIKVSINAIWNEQKVQKDVTSNQVREKGQQLVNIKTNNAANKAQINTLEM